MCFFHLLMLNFYLLIHNNFCFINWENTSPHWIGSTTYSRVSQAWLTGSSFEWVLTLGDLLFPHKIDFNFRHWEKKISETLSEPSPHPHPPKQPRCSKAWQKSSVKCQGFQIVILARCVGSHYWQWHWKTFFLKK